MRTFVFLHVELEPERSPLFYPTVLVRSLRVCQKDSVIIQCSDRQSPEVPGVDRVARFDGDSSKLMTFRLSCFSRLSQIGPAVYLDTDMICVRPLDPAAILGDANIALCKREYEVNHLLSKELRSLLPEYTDRTLGEIWPYVACCSVTQGPEFWIDCAAELATLNTKFQDWYGDQEAMRNIATLGKYKIRNLPETIYGNLDAIGKRAAAGTSPTPPRLIHFKGLRGKRHMAEYAKKIGLI